MMSCTTTVRSHKCSGSTPTGLCRACTESKRLLLKKHLRHNLSEKREIKNCTPLSKVSRKQVQNALKVERTEKKLALKQLQDIKKLIKKEQVEVSDSAHNQLQGIMEAAQKDSFTSMFWEEQKKAFQHSPEGMRWHPMMVRFAILLHSQSPSTYRTLKDVGVVRLPSESTLRDYTNIVHPHSGFQIEVFEELKRMATPLSPQERFVCLLHDEISIKSDLVYDKRSGELVGFIDPANWSKSSAKESNLANHALVFMVVGITTNIKMSIGYFPTRTATSDELFPLLWRAVGLLECVSDLKVSSPACCKQFATCKLD